MNLGLLRTGIAQIVEPFVVDGESEGILPVVVRDLENEDGVVIITRPGGNLRGHPKKNLRSKNEDEDDNKKPKTGRLRLHAGISRSGLI